MDKLYVICVDDQREVLSAVYQDLRPLEQWLNIEECESADEVLALMDELDAEGKMVALLISDHVMPGKTGVELLTDISKDSRFVKTRKVLLTGQATHTDTINAINAAGIDRYFEKPWQAEQLIECCKTLVTHYVFDMGLDYSQYHEHLDQSVVFQRLR